MSRQIVVVGNVVKTNASTSGENIPKGEPVENRIEFTVAGASDLPHWLLSAAANTWTIARQTQYRKDGTAPAVDRLDVEPTEDGKGWKLVEPKAQRLARIVAQLRADGYTDDDIQAMLAQ